MNWLQRFGLWLAAQGGWNPVPSEDLQRAHATLMRLHEQTRDELAQAVQARDSAVKAFEAYAAKNLGVNADLRIRAEYLVDGLMRKGKHLSGEFKRHQVYADLIKEFPQTDKRDLSLAIEMAVRAKG